MHVPVMVAEVMEYLAPRAGAVILDATCGLGGHTRALAEAGATVIACDRDLESLERARETTVEFAERIRFHQATFAQIGETLAALKIKQLDGLLADLGVSRYQLTSGERGFSLMSDGPLDMRMDRSHGSTQGRTAADIVNYESEKELADLIYRLGEERRSTADSQSNRAGAADYHHRSLGQADREAVPRTGKIHPATQTFMALRIAVNQENEELDALLDAIPKAGEAGRAGGDAHVHVAGRPDV